MITTPEITRTAARPLAKIHLTVPKAEIRSVMGPGLREIMAALGAQGVTPAGPWLNHHLGVDPTVFDFEICVPVAAPVVASGRMVPGEWPGMTVARTLYQGPYEGLGAAWGEFNGWIAANGHAPAADFWECYLVGPESGSDPSDWRTELNRPLVD